MISNKEGFGPEFILGQTLGKQQKTVFKDLATRASNTARSYDGSRAKHDALERTIAALRNYIAPLVARGTHNEDDILTDFARQTNLLQSDRYSIKALQDIAFNNFLPATPGMPTDLRRLVGVLTSLDAPIEGSSLLLLIKSERGGSVLPGYQPRIAQTLRVLFECGIPAQEITYMISNAHSLPQLNQAHVVMSVPSKNLQIAVSDLVTREAYIHRGLVALSYWQSITAEMLAESENVQCVRSHNDFPEIVRAAVMAKSFLEVSDNLKLDEGDLTVDGGETIRERMAAYLRIKKGRDVGLIEINPGNIADQLMHKMHLFHFTEPEVDLDAQEEGPTTIRSIKEATAVIPPKDAEPSQNVLPLKDTSGLERVMNTLSSDDFLLLAGQQPRSCMIRIFIAIDSLSQQEQRVALSRLVHLDSYKSIQAFSPSVALHLQRLLAAQSLKAGFSAAEVGGILEGSEPEPALNLSLPTIRKVRPPPMRVAKALPADVVVVPAPPVAIPVPVVPVEDVAMSVTPQQNCPKIITLLVRNFNASNATGRVSKVQYEETADTPVDLDEVNERIAAFIAENRIFPNLEADGSDFWKEQDKWLQASENMSLSRYVVYWSRQLVEQYRSDHGNMSPGETSGVIDGYDPLTWSDLKECFLRDPSKPSFEAVTSFNVGGKLPARNIP